MNTDTKRSSSTQVIKAQLRFDRRFRKMMRALGRLAKLELADLESVKHITAVLEHSRARILLDVAEANQELALAECNRLDRVLREFEARR